MAIWLFYLPIRGKFLKNKIGQYNELPVYKATYDLLLGMFWFTKEFSKEFKYTVGESLKNTVELSIYQRFPVYHTTLDY